MLPSSQKHQPLDLCLSLTGALADDFAYGSEAMVDAAPSGMHVETDRAGDAYASEITGFDMRKP
jgi:hypothetical protein